MEIDRATFEVVLANFLVFLGEKSAEYIRERKFKWAPDSYVAVRGPKNVKIVVQERGESNSRRVYCFLDYQGNIYKAASWKAPAKHIRGNIIADHEYSWGKGLGDYGATYLR